MIRRTALLSILLAGSVAAGADVAFTAKPSVAKAGDKIEIHFAVSRETDATVSIETAAGETVRHLASGLLGNHPPPPFKPGLKQEILWDGADDFGRPAAAGCKVRVGLGLSARLGKILFSEPGLPYSPRSAAVGPDGLVYVLSEAHQIKSTFLLQAFTQDGQYVKTIMPYPANLPPPRLTGLPRLLAGANQPAVPGLQPGDQIVKINGRDAWDLSGVFQAAARGFDSVTLLVKRAGGGKNEEIKWPLPFASPTHSSASFMPVVFQAVFREIYPNSIGMRAQRMLITPQGWILMASATRTHNGGTNPQRLLVVDTDGGTPCKGYVGPLLGPEPLAHGLCWLAASPDGQWLYTSGQRKGNGNEDSAGPASQIPTPAIPLAWPYAVSVGKSGVYVSDVVNRRILRLDLVFAVEATCDAGS